MTWLHAPSSSLVPLVLSFSLMCAGLLAPAPSGAAPFITGTASYRERLALPPNAVFEATLEDVSRADAPSVVMGRLRRESPGNPPIRFGIPYDATRIASGHTYVVRARISSEDRLLFTTDAVYPVLTGGHGKEANLLLKAAGGARIESPAPKAEDASAGSPLGALPANFEGDLPCADCEGVRWRLELFPDWTYFLRAVYLGKEPNRQDEIGSWALGSNGDTLTLHGGRKTPHSFFVMSPSALRKLDRVGGPIVSTLNYDLARQESPSPLEPRLAMRGMYRYMADAGIFVECLTGRRFPVAMEGDNAALEAAYSQARREPAEEILVSLEGRLAPRPKMEGEGTQLSLVVDHMIGVWPGETCGARMSVASLENTYWSLTVLGAEPVRFGEKKHPYFVLNGEDKHLTGSGGCNRLTGSYHVSGNELRFDQIASTRMACIEGMEREAAMTAMMEQVRTWKLLGTHLELYDASGTMIAVLVARAMN